MSASPVSLVWAALLMPSAEVTAPLAVAVGLIAGYWLLRVAREARWGFQPRVAWWAVPGLLLLLLAPLLDVPALFGVGAGLLLLSEFWPAAFVRASARPGWQWPLVGVLVGAALAVVVTRSAQVETFAAFTALACLLWGLGGLLAAGLQPRAARPLGFETRWKATVTPEWPELSVSVSARGAHLKNVSRSSLRVAGWSPAGVNAWYRLRSEDGRALNELRAGQVAFLPLGARDAGVRVWYVPAGGAQPHLFQADWTPPARAQDRVLN